MLVFLSCATSVSRLAFSSCEDTILGFVERKARSNTRNSFSRREYSEVPLSILTFLFPISNLSSTMASDKYGHDPFIALRTYATQNTPHS